MGVSYEINPEYAGQLKPLVEILSGGKIPPEAECIYTGRNRLYTLRQGELTVNIKEFRIPKFPNNFIYKNLRKSKALRSYLYANELLKRGLPSPTPLAYVEITRRGLFKKSYYVSMQSPYSETLREWEKRAPSERDELLNAYAGLMARMHQAGIRHLDLSPGNVLWQRNPHTGEFDFHVIDLNRMKIYDRPLTLAEAFTNFRNINLIEEETRRLGYIYGQVTGLDPDECADRAVQVLRDDRKRKQRVHRLKALKRKKRKDRT